MDLRLRYHRLIRGALHLRRLLHRRRRRCHPNLRRHRRRHHRRRRHRRHHCRCRRRHLAKVKSMIRGDSRGKGAQVPQILGSMKIHQCLFKNKNTHSKFVSVRTIDEVQGPPRVRERDKSGCVKEQKRIVFPSMREVIDMPYRHINIFLISFLDDLISQCLRPPWV